MLLAVIIPCYKTPRQAIKVVKECLNFADFIICIDDFCPFNTGKEIENNIDSKNLHVLYHKYNKGVGGAMKTGIKNALDLGAEIIIKVDSDGQMPTHLIPDLVEPIKNNRAELTKGNRFQDLNIVIKMPKLRFLGNLMLSFLSKLSTGYWELFDPTNGFIAINSKTIKHINLNKLSDDYFFETDLLFRCSINNFRVTEIPMEANYGDEISSLNPIKEIPNFLTKHIINFTKRIAYSYFIYDFNPGSISLVLSFLFGSSSILLGGLYFSKSFLSKTETPFGVQTLFLALVFIATQFVFNFLYYDVSQKPLFRKLR